MGDRKGKRGETTPALPDIPTGGRLWAKVLPAWMYGDPAGVVERAEQGVINARERKAEREAQRVAERHRAAYGLVGPGTVRLINRCRIRELLAQVMGRKR